MAPRVQEEEENGGCRGRFLAEDGAVARTPTLRDYPKGAELHARQRAMSTASTGPCGVCSRYCSYLSISLKSARSRSGPSSRIRAVPSMRTHHSCDQSSST